MPPWQGRRGTKRELCQVVRLVSGLPTKVLQRGAEDLRDARRVLLQLSRSRVANNSEMHVVET